LWVDHSFDSILPCAIKINTLDFRENVHDDGGASHAEELIALDEVLGGQVVERRAEFSQRAINRLGVVGVWFYEEVDILGRRGCA
jgi:hypothetical protein